ncbi:DegT/DnrJ/EryC1/StrS aminotransferase [Ornatilinea apprima]|uniref:DegT/DnrJ/EryC1/StrS aminotransferase n=1 Tax=Ornatilinea apprima TaxID=1134406 RepID=A0A0P6WZ78_9CHLR|nr:DegT/DnrJ/EryC1/StrS family aminotransferase [Ornatilinea apprima]KPL72022.1 DegT/DnrJ/EryC1/StrS aminotransferase [Ornatilinea apprima]
MELKIPLADIDFNQEEEEAVLRVLRSRWLTMGAVTQEFEQAFAQYVGAKHALAVSNCTQALHLACLALGIGEHDEVILPSLSFVATANCVLYCGANPVFADIFGNHDLTISPQEIEKKITAKTRAIIMMHYGGYACQIEEILEIARKNRLAVIEDAAHAPGAVFANRHVGTWGDVGCYSFFSNKNLVTGEGGMLVTDRDDVAERVKQLRSHGMTSLTWDRHRGHAYTYDVMALGYNYRIDEIRSALGLAQLRKLEGNNARRRYLTDIYRQRLSEGEFFGIETPFLSNACLPACHLFPILLPAAADRQELITGLRKRGIQTSIHYPPIHLFSYYQQRFPGIQLPQTEQVAARELTLPLYPMMSEADVGYVLDGVCEEMRQAVH